MPITLTQFEEYYLRELEMHTLGAGSDPLWSCLAFSGGRITCETVCVAYTYSYNHTYFTRCV